MASLRRHDAMYYFQERHFFTYFSALLLAGTALIAALVNFLHQKIVEGHKALNFWLISALGFFYLSLDEYFMIHEGMGRGILRFLGQDVNALNFDGVILGLFGVIGIGIVCRWRKQVLQFGNFIFMFLVATLFFICMIVSDQFLPEVYPLTLFEEIFKILGVAFFFVAYLSVLYDIHMQLIHTEIITESAE